MPHYVVFGSRKTGWDGVTGVRTSPYPTVEEARTAGSRSAEQARAHGIDQWHRIVEAETHQDALLFASNAKPPAHVLERMFGDANHDPQAPWVDQD